MSISRRGFVGALGALAVSSKLPIPKSTAKEAPVLIGHVLRRVGVGTYMVTFSGTVDSVPSSLALSFKPERTTVPLTLDCVENMDASYIDVY